MQPRAKQLFTLFFIAMCVCSIGCSYRQEVFTGHTADEVWTAMKAAAQTPMYASDDITRRWTVRENDVWVSDEESRIEIHRRVERILKKPNALPLHETREWKSQIILEQLDPPIARYTVRNFGVPAHAWEEADMYFDEVWDLLYTPGQQRIEQSAPEVDPPLTPMPATYD